VGSIATIPIVGSRKSPIRGVISLKFQDRFAVLDDTEQDFLRRTANTLAGVLAGAVTVQELKTDLKRVERERKVAKQIVADQRKIVEHEKVATMAELAGAAAHELNQPLTSVMASLALLKRCPGDEERLYKAMNTMEHEIERMALIVRRLGNLTEYATKEYVADTKIIDLERAAELKDDECGREKNES